MKKDIVKTHIKTIAKELKLPYITRNIEDEIKEANIKNLTYEAFLLSSIFLVIYGNFNSFAMVFI
ncbi:hypothetical protein LIP37_12255, partial [Anaerosalibacter bizertensis]